MDFLYLTIYFTDEMDIPPKPSEGKKTSEKGNSLADMSLQELVTVLTDMVGFPYIF